MQLWMFSKAVILKLVNEFCCVQYETLVTSIWMDG